MKNYQLLLLTLPFAACVQPGAKISLTNANTVVVTEMFDAFNAHDWQRMANCYKDTAMLLDPALGHEAVPFTREQTIKKYQELQQQFPDVHDEVKTMYGDKNHIIVEFVSSGTGPDGKKWQLPICVVFTVDNGKIARDHTYYDNSH